MSFTTCSCPVAMTHLLNSSRRAPSRLPAHSVSASSCALCSLRCCLGAGRPVSMMVATYARHSTAGRALELLFRRVAVPLSYGKGTCTEPAQSKFGP